MPISTDSGFSCDGSGYAAIADISSTAFQNGSSSLSAVTAQQPLSCYSAAAAQLLQRSSSSDLQHSSSLAAMQHELQPCSMHSLTA